MNKNKKKGRLWLSKLLRERKMRLLRRMNKSRITWIQKPMMNNQLHRKPRMKQLVRLALRIPKKKTKRFFLLFLSMRPWRKSR